MEVLKKGLDYGESSLIAEEFLGLLDAAKAAKRLKAGVRDGHSFAEV
jgi:hypothetical protein